LFFFKIYIINDIADDMLGLCRLYGVDKSAGEKSFEINNLRSIWLTLIKTNITHWGETVASQTKPRTLSQTRSKALLTLPKIK
jgi:hypothetical protein